MGPRGEGLGLLSSETRGPWDLGLGDSRRPVLGEGALELRDRLRFNPSCDLTSTQNPDLGGALGQPGCLALLTLVTSCLSLRVLWDELAAIRLQKLEQQVLC